MVYDLGREDSAELETPPAGASGSVSSGTVSNCALEDEYALMSFCFRESDSIIPTPAAAPPFTPSYAQIRAGKSHINLSLRPLTHFFLDIVGSRGYMRRGRIQVIVKSETFPKSDRTLYVGSMINTTWRSIETTSRPYEAAVVCLTEAGYDYHLSLEVSEFRDTYTPSDSIASQNHEYESLGVSWDSVLGG